MPKRANLRRNRVLPFSWRFFLTKQIIDQIIG
jgi:hypothetical protein